MLKGKGLVWGGCALLALAIGLMAGPEARAQAVPETFNYQGRLFESGGQPVTGTVPMTFGLWNKAVTQDPVVNESVTMAGTSPIPLAHQHLVPGSVVVTAVGGVPTYETPRDYLIDFANGTITRAPSGFILDGTPVEVDYIWTNSGTLAWSEEQAVAVAGGLYNVVLGVSTPLPAAVFSDPNVFLEVTVNGEALSPRTRLTSVPYALQAENANMCFEADYFDGFDSTDFAFSFHIHDASEIASGTVGLSYYSAYADLGDEGYLDNNDPADLLTQGQSDGRFVNTQGDDAMAGSLTVGGHLGVGAPPDLSSSISNNPLTADTYGAIFYGSFGGVYGINRMTPSSHAILGAQDTGVSAHAGTDTTMFPRFGGLFGAQSRDTAYGVYSAASGFGYEPAYAFYGSAHGATSGDVYGGRFEATTWAVNPGRVYGLYASGDDYAAWFNTGAVHVGDGGTENFAFGTGDLYVQHDLEVDGIAHFSGGIDAPGAIDPADVSFNYAGSSSQGGPANDLACMSCITAEEIEPYTVISELIYEDGAGSNLDADLLDGQHGSYYQNASNISAGTLGVSYYSAYSDLTAEGYLDNNAAADLLTRSQSDARFSPLTHNHSAADINAGTLGAAYYSAYSDLTAEGYLDNNAAGDLLTQTQGDGRFVNTTGDDIMSGSLTVGGDLQVSGGNIGLMTAAAAGAGITNHMASAPSYGAYLYGSNYGLYGMWNSDPLDHYGHLGSQTYGVFARAGNSDETGDRYGANFSAHTQDTARGVYAIANGYGASPAVGGDFVTGNHGTGAHYGVRGFGNSSSSSGALSYGVWGQGFGYNVSSTNYGGYFTTGGAGMRYGVYGQGYNAGGVFTYQGDTANSRVTLATSSIGITVDNGSPAAAMTRTGIDVNLQTSGGWLYGANYDIDSWATASYPTYGNYITVNMHNNPSSAYGVYSAVDGDTSTGHQIAVYATASGYNGGTTYGLYGYASNVSGTAYGLYASAGNSDDYAGYFNVGKVRVGAAGTPAYNTGSGDFYAADAIEAGGDFYYTADKTRYFTLSRVGEWDGFAGRSWDPGTTSSYCPDGTTCGTYYAVNLPDRATVTAFRVWGNTTSASHTFSCALYMSSVTTGDFTNMAYLSSSNTNMTLADTSIVSADIDNANYAYMVNCTESTTSRLAHVYLYGIRIDYTVDGPE